MEAFIHYQDHPVYAKISCKKNYYKFLHIGQHCM